MKANLKTNKREYKKRLKKYILETLKEDYKEYNNKSRATEKQALQHFINRFNSEFNYDYNIKQYPNIIDRAENYLQGLPFSFPYMYHNIIKDVAKLHKVDINTITESQRDTIGQTYFNKISKEIIIMCKKFA
tara:strand:+ start:1209 stop:1604 length:396 start_codon:yes stop_codon:yes gene_type:complete